MIPLVLLTEETLPDLRHGRWEGGVNCVSKPPTSLGHRRDSVLAKDNMAELERHQHLGGASQCLIPAVSPWLSSRTSTQFLQLERGRSLLGKAQWGLRITHRVPRFSVTSGFRGCLFSALIVPGYLSHNSLILFHIFSEGERRHIPNAGAQVNSFFWASSCP